jgi:hypothetical protein
MEEVKTRTPVQYVPKLEGRKWVTKTTTGGDNGGLHKQEEFAKGVEMLDECARTFRNPRLFHVCLTGAPVAVYQFVMRRFCRALKGEGVDYKWKAATELDADKGLHWHVMIVLGCDRFDTDRFITAKDEPEVENESTLRKAVRDGWGMCSYLDYRVNRPRSRKGVAYIQFNQSNQAMFDEAVEWMSYAYKARSKPAAGTVYYSDRQGTGSSDR